LNFRINNQKAGKIDATLSETSFGHRALNANTGADNVAFGIQAGLTNTSGNLNTAIGAYSLNLNVVGNNNTAVGYQSLRSTTGSNNTAIGTNSAFSSTGSFITALGSNTLYLNTTGVDNTAMGFEALYSTATGSRNTGVGLYALRSTTGNNNTSLGWNSGDFNTSGTLNTYLGYNADATVNNLTNATAIGANAVVSQSNSLILGNAANVGIGTSTPTTLLHINSGVSPALRLVDGTQGAGKVLTSDASGNATWQNASAGSDWTLTGNAGTVDGTNFIGTTDNIPFNIRVNNLKSGRVSPTTFETSLGYQALRVNTGNNNTALGNTALFNNTSGNGNTAIGSSASRDNVIGINTTAVGYSALMLNTASNNSAFGYTALSSNTSGTLNTALGYGSLSTNSSGNNNTGVGSNSMQFATGTDNTSVGYFSLRNSTGNNNTALGSSSGNINTTGSNNTFVGSNTNPSVNNLTNATAIGANTVVSQSNSLILGNAANVGIGTSTPSQLLTISAATNPIFRLERSNVSAFDWEISANGLGFQINGGADATGVGLTNFVTVDGFGKVGIGTNAPTTLLHLNSATSPAFRLVDGTQGAGKVLTSDASGNATWQNASAGNAWTILGNAGTVDGTNFIGTTDNVPFNIRVNNLKAGRIDAANSNTFYGYRAAEVNTGGQNTAVGTNALIATTAGGQNTAVGATALATNTTGTLNTALGYNANVASSGLTNATAIGANATVSSSNSVVIGNAAKVGIGISSPLADLHVANNTNSIIFNQVAAGTSNVQSGIIMARSRGTTSAPSVVFGGDSFGEFGFIGYDGTGFNVPSAGIRAEATENFTAAALGTAMYFSTTANGTNSSQERMMIDQNGNIGINELAPSTLLHITGTSPVFRLQDGTEGLGRVLTSDANGNATWQAAAAGITGTGVATRVAFWNTASSLSSNSNLYWENTNGRLGVGTSTPQYRLTVAGDGTSNLSSVMGVEAYGTGAGSNTLAIIMRRAGGTQAVPTATSNNESLGTFGFQGHTGGGFSANLSSFIGAQATENWTVGANGSGMNFHTTPNGSTTNVKRLGIASDGNIIVGSGTSATENNAITVALTNNTGAACTAGDIVIVGGVDNSFTTTASPGNYSVIGVVIDGASNGAVARVAVSGVVTVNVGAAAVVRGQHCITSATSGKAAGIAIPNAGTSIGVFITNGSAGGTAKVLLK